MILNAGACKNPPESFDLSGLLYFREYPQLSRALAMIDAPPMTTQYEGTAVQVINADARRVVTSETIGTTAWVWNAEMGKRLGEPRHHEAFLTGADFSPDGRQVVTSSDAPHLDFAGVL